MDLQAIIDSLKEQISDAGLEALEYNDSAEDYHYYIGVRNGLSTALNLIEQLNTEV